jgi:arylsulfatase A-like enzyme
VKAGSRAGRTLALVGSAWIAVLGVATLAAGCAPEPPLNVVVVLADTLRAQSLSAYGYERETSPHLSAFAEEALLFEDARAQAPCTYPSANSILTGRDGTHFWVQQGQRIGIPEGTPSLAEILGGQGYATVAVSASPIVRKSPTKFNRFGGFDRGFDLFDERCLWQDASCLNDFALPYLEVLREPFFLYLHYMDPHDPWKPAEPRWSKAPYQGKWFVEAGNPNPIADLLYGEPEVRFEVDDRDLAHLTNLYDDEIAFFDARFGELHRALRESGRLDRTIVAVVADHGEEFLEHGHIKHCHALYDTEIRTPLLLALPGVEGGRRLAGEVENLDLVPTLLDYLGVETPDLRLDGASLRPLIERARAVHEQAFSAWGVLRAVKAGRFKLVMDLDSGEVELYDLEADPGETRNVAGEHPREVQRLQRALSTRLREVEGVQDAGQAVRRGEEASERLRALGYIQ